MIDTAAGNDSFATLVSSLASLAQHVQTSINLIDSAIAQEIISDDKDTSIVVLDDITPQYLKASHALNRCSASLDAALKSLLEGNAHRLLGEQALRLQEEQAFPHREIAPMHAGSDAEQPCPHRRLTTS